MKMISIALSALTTAEMLSLSGEMLLRGMGTVFMVLIILWAILGIFGKVFGGVKKEAKAAPAPKAPAAPKESAAPAAPHALAPTAAPAVSPAPAADDSQLIAVITAAIAAYQSASGQPNLPFRVVSFTRKNNASGWMGNSADNQ